VTRIDDKSGRLQVVPAGWVDAAASRLSPVEVIRSGHRAPEVTLCYLRRSVQVARPERRAGLLVMRRSGVRFPKAALGQRPLPIMEGAFLLRRAVSSLT
jgi:hypothetical protein